jgi:hypothetical protein
MVAAKAKAAAQVQTATGRGMRIGQFVLQLLNIIEDAHRPALHPLTVVGQGDTSTGAVQQAAAKGGFKDLDTFADIGRGQSQLFCRRGKAALAHNRKEHPQVFRQRRSVFFGRHGHERVATRMQRIAQRKKGSTCSSSNSGTSSPM